MNFRAGECRESIRIEQPVKATNAYGEVTHTWSTFCTRWAKIEGKQLDEYVNGERVRTVGTHMVSFRPFTVGLATDMRIVWVSRPPGRTLDIVNITEIGNREGHKLTCKEQSS